MPARIMLDRSWWKSHRYRGRVSKTRYFHSLLITGVHEQVTENEMPKILSVGAKFWWTSQICMPLTWYEKLLIGLLKTRLHAMTLCKCNSVDRTADAACPPGPEMCRVVRQLVHCSASCPMTGAADSSWGSIACFLSLSRDWRLVR